MFTDKTTYVKENDVLLQARLNFVPVTNLGCVRNEAKLLVDKRVSKMKEMTTKQLAEYERLNRMLYELCLRMGLSDSDSEEGGNSD